MAFQCPSLRLHFLSRKWRFLASALVILEVGACAGGPAELPPPRPIVIRSGARLYPEKERMEEIDSWFRPEMQNIEQDPTFWIETVSRDTQAYPWESLLIQGDTARIGVERSASPEARTAFSVYAHLRLMSLWGRLEEFIPEVTEGDGYPVERAILSKVSDVWFFARGVYDAPAFDPLEELLFANEAGYLDPFILTARGDDFGDQRARWLREDPEALERYRAWFVETFEREPPGLREGT